MSNRVFVDTNVFLRLFTLDEPAQAKAAIDLLQTAQAGKLILVVNVVTISELVWALERIYKIDRPTIRRNILALQNTHGIEMEQSDIIVNAVDIYALKNIDFGDAYSICWMQANGITTAYTFDHRHFSRVAGIDVNVPGRPSI